MEKLYCHILSYPWWLFVIAKNYSKTMTLQVNCSRSVVRNLYSFNLEVPNTANPLPYNVRISVNDFHT